MPPKRTAQSGPPPVDSVAAIRSFLRDEPGLNKVFKEETARLVSARTVAATESEKDGAVSDTSRLRLNGALKSLLLPFMVRALLFCSPLAFLTLSSGLGRTYYCSPPEGSCFCGLRLERLRCCLRAQGLVPPLRRAFHPLRCSRRSGLSTRAQERDSCSCW